MLSSILRPATACLLLSVAFGASAGNKTYQDLELSGVLQEIPGPSPRCASQFGGTILGYGNSALLGRVTFLASDCITPSGTSYTFSDGRFMITTLTGELLFAAYSGQFVPTGEGTKYVFSNATFQITGGTGRYAKASGGGDLVGGEDMATGQGTIQLKGRILVK
ncbi:hypothetical protein [uncultured Massilia sp.]|uniref:hypothetical protein n=1 Tax=uncultured Massilia sp. TaxID=169973 RepID=UPI0025EBDF28|nr:hypothetical protein [uncultured Massilia sp.]